MDRSSLSALFEGSEAFLTLLLRQCARTSQVVFRCYGNGAWHQFSGKDFLAHLGRAAASWQKDLEDKSQDQAILFICRNTYSSLVASYGALVAGFDAMFLPSQVSEAQLDWCISHFKGVAIATDIDELVHALARHSLPVYNIGKMMWAPQDKHAEPVVFQAFREFRTAEDTVQAVESTRGVLTEQNKSSPQSVPNRGRMPSRIGQFQFISFGNDGFQKPGVLKADAVLLTSHNFNIHVGIPPAVQWKTLELLAPSSPFAQVARLAVLLKNGVLGFPNLSADWETNLRILRPTVLFAGPTDLLKTCHFIEEVARRPGYKQRLQVSEGIEKVQSALSSSKIARLPEGLFDIAKKGVRLASRTAVGSAFVKDAVEDLRCVIHGMAPANENCVKLLERVGVPVIETYGTTEAAGLLSSNTFESPHFNLIGSPLAHVSFRLGSNSTLEYKISSPLFKNANEWTETGDVMQMTAHGFAVAGRQRHLFVTAGGVTVSPVRLERLLRDNTIVADACIVGDRMPFLGALIVLTPEASTEYRIEPGKVRDAVGEIIARVNETLPRNVTIKKFQILEKPFQEHNGEKLSSGDINRLKIQQTRESVIAAMYQ